MKYLFIYCSLFFSLQVWGQNLDNDISKFAPFIQSLRDFSRHIPHEKVYLHFDNTSYYQGDSIWFKCYVVTSEQNQLSPYSKTLYVELLNPGGEIIDKRILRIENGQCHGEFALNQLMFYSGFYEVRAYTKYMLNFGDDAIFSRLLPVFDKPKTEGNFEEKEMVQYNRWGKYPIKREHPVRENRVNLRFFPEGGNLIQGIASQIAFEATDEAGNPIDVTGVVMNAAGQELSQITTLHEGRGVFTYTPTGATGRQRDIAEVEYSGRKYRFDMPASLPHGVVMEVNNLSYPDSIDITLRKSRYTPSAEMLGVAVLSGGRLQNYFYVWIEDDEVISYKIDKTRLSSGVSQIVLFNSMGEIICDRLIFVANKKDRIDIKAKTGKPFYMPYELVEMEFSVTDMMSNPVNTTFSLSVRDSENEVEGNHNILTDLLLMSEIKGYVRNPAYYFEEKNNTVETRHATSLHLDLLLMVQGWRRYSWNRMTGVEPFALEYLPEQGIEVSGRVVDVNLRGMQTPKPDVDVSVLLFQKGKEEEREEFADFAETFVTDKDGRFSFTADVAGRWNMIFGVTEKGRPRNYLVLLNRLFSPKPKRYRFADMQVNIAEKRIENIIIADEEETPEYEDIIDDYASLFAAYQDSIARLGFNERVNQLSEVTVTARRRTREQQIFENRSTSITYYDPALEYDDLYDSGTLLNDDIHQFIMQMNSSFSVQYGASAIGEGRSYAIISRFVEIGPLLNFNEPYDILIYNNKLALCVVNYEPVQFGDEFSLFGYQQISLRSIKNIYINENIDAIIKYIIPPPPPPGFPPITATQIVMGWRGFSGYSCVVFIETYPDGEIPVEDGKGIRKTWLEGYSGVSEFYSPNYSGLPPVLPDYRRTLYWNPAVTTDENGKANIQFYNNSRSKNFSISAETVTQQGMIGIYKDK